MAQDVTKNLMDFIAENGIATDAEITLVTCINGTSVESLWSIIEVRTGLRNSAQLLAEGYNVEDDVDLGR